MDWLHSVLKWVDHYRWTVISLVVGLGLFGVVLGLQGCASTVRAPDGSGDMLNRSEFRMMVASMETDLTKTRIHLDAALAEYNADVSAHNATIEAGVEQLDRQDAIRADVLETVGAVAVTAAEGTLNPISLIPSGIGLVGLLLGIGASTDSRRKDKVITTIKNGIT